MAIGIDLLPSNHLSPIANSTGFPLVSWYQVENQAAEKCMSCTPLLSGMQKPARLFNSAHFIFLIRCITYPQRQCHVWRRYVRLRSTYWALNHHKKHLL
ncbi:hypothetical protein FHS27_002364 [Rhodopirellula rubra]|uniref:Uncharacterized protein n=1 Tax=Aporhodopirellula rubra TaxID=980271 RepID=A0A7W5DY29_9BACT|nr:hypothetical protein [Aporhodopirellula rubra]